jgi:hypothetical protein
MIGLQSWIGQTMVAQGDATLPSRKSNGIQLAFHSYSLAWLRRQSLLQFNNSAFGNSFTQLRHTPLMRQYLNAQALNVATSI